MSRWVGAGGYEVEAIVLDGRQLLRIRQHGYLVAYCRTIAETAQYVDLADLVEVIDIPGAEIRRD
jgi:hypothetical protein